MEEVEKLQAIFKELQKKDARHKLSERNVVEIVLKLLELKKVNLIFSLTGKEYITPNQLEREIQDALLEHGGRLNVLELQPLLNVDMEHIDAKIAEMVQKDPQLTLVNGELITRYYLDRVAEETNETLQDTGAVHIGDLAKRFGLFTEFLNDVIAVRLGRIIKGSLEDGMLYTQAYVDRYAARIRGIFSAVTRPTAISQIQAKYNLQDSLFYSILERLVNDGRLDGGIQGRRDRAQYVPTIYAHTRQMWIESHFASNGHMDYKTVEKMGIADARNYLHTRFPDALCVQEHIISATTVMQVDESICEALTAGSYVDAQPLLPFLDLPNVSTVLQSCQQLKQFLSKGEASVLGENFVVSKAFLDRVMKLFEESYNERARSTRKLSSSADSAPTGDSKKLKSSTGGTAVAAEPPKGGGKGKRGGGKGKKEEEAAASASKGRKGKLSSSSSNTDDAGIEEDYEQNMACLQKWFEDSNEEFLAALLQHLRSSLAELKERTARNVYIDSGSQKKRHQSAEEEINSLYLSLQLYHKSAQDLKLAPEELEAIDRHLLRTVAADLVHAIICDQAITNCVEVQKVTASNRSEILGKLPSSSVKALDRLVKVLSKTLDEFIKELEDFSEKSQLQLKPLDKKTEKLVLQNHRAQLMSALESESNPATAFQLTLLSLVHKYYSLALHIPTKVISAVLERVRAKAPTEVFQPVSYYNGLVVEYLAAKAELAREAAADADATLASSPTFQELMARLDALKALVLGPRTEATAGKQQEEKKEKDAANEGTGEAVAAAPPAAEDAEPAAEVEDKPKTPAGRRRKVKAEQ